MPFDHDEAMKMLRSVEDNYRASQEAQTPAEPEPETEQPKSLTTTDHMKDWKRGKAPE